MAKKKYTIWKCIHCGATVSVFDAVSLDMKTWVRVNNVMSGVCCNAPDYAFGYPESNDDGTRMLSDDETMITDIPADVRKDRMVWIVDTL